MCFYPFANALNNLTVVRCQKGKKVMGQFRILRNFSGRFRFVDALQSPISQIAVIYTFAIIKIIPQITARASFILNLLRKKCLQELCKLPLVLFVVNQQCCVFNIIYHHFRRASIFEPCGKRQPIFGPFTSFGMLAKYLHSKI